MNSLPSSISKNTCFSTFSLVKKTDQNCEWRVHCIGTLVPVQTESTCSCGEKTSVPPNYDSNESAQVERGEKGSLEEKPTRVLKVRDRHSRWCATFLHLHSGHRLHLRIHVLERLLWGLSLLAKFQASEKKKEGGRRRVRVGDSNLNRKAEKDCASKETLSNDSSLCVLRVGSEEDDTKQLEEASHVRVKIF